MSELENEVQRLTAELTKAKEMLAVRTAIIDMAILNAISTHSILNWAAYIRDRSLVLCRNFQDRSEHNTIRDLNRIEEYSKKILEIVDNPKAPSLMAKEGLEIICLNDLLRKCDQFIDATPDDGVTLKLELGPDDQIMVRANDWWMERVLEIIIKNASKAMFYSSNKTLTISSSVVEGSLVEIVLQDTGRGIPEEIRPKIFRERIIRPRARVGQGVGLLIALTIVHVYDGDIDIQKTGPDGTALAILMPQASLR